jgi:hypothetical protein
MTELKKRMICLGPIILLACYPVIFLVLGQPEYAEFYVGLMVSLWVATIVCTLFAIGLVTNWIEARMLGQPKWIKVIVSAVTVFGLPAAYMATSVAGCAPKLPGIYRVN